MCLATEKMWESALKKGLDNGEESLTDTLIKVHEITKTGTSLEAAMEQLGLREATRQRLRKMQASGLLS